MQVINLTPHELTLVGSNEEVIERIPSSGITRVSEVVETLGNINGIPLVKKTFGKVEGLPDPQDGVVYYVSAITASAVQGRDDVVIGGESVRNDNGQIIGIKSFARMA